MRQTRILVAALLLVLLGLGSTPPLAAQGPTEIRGADILGHPAGKLALKIAELLAAGKVEDVIRFRTAADQAEWKKETAADRQDSAARMKERAPEPKVLDEEIRKGGVLTVYPGRASLESPYGTGRQVVALFTSENGKWYGSMGPMVMAGSSAPATELRIQGADIAKHPVYAVALEYANTLHTGTGDAFMKLASSEAQAAWKAEPASERAESTAYRKKNVPKKAALAAGIQAGGVLIVEDDSRATLNVVTVEQKSTKPGVVEAASTTLAIPFVLEGGQWKLAR